MLMLREAGLILRKLRGLGLEVIVLKGLYLVENVYQDISLRVFGDLHLLLRKSDHWVLFQAIQGPVEAVWISSETCFES